jgi:hypothetical protein
MEECMQKWINTEKFKAHMFLRKRRKIKAQNHLSSLIITSTYTSECIFVYICGEEDRNIEISC